jgi:hypothetical protein
MTNSGTIFNEYGIPFLLAAALAAFVAFVVGKRRFLVQRLNGIRGRSWLAAPQPSGAGL